MQASVPFQYVIWFFKMFYIMLNFVYIGCSVKEGQDERFYFNIHIYLDILNLVILRVQAALFYFV